MTARGRMPLAEALAHFRAGLPEVAHLESGTTQRDTLVRRFLVAVERRDTTTIRSLLLSRAEFAYLYFPHSVFSRRPYRQDPALAWFLSQQESRKGITRVLNRFGGTPGVLVAHGCTDRMRAEGPFRIWEECRVTVRESDGTLGSLRLFGPILEYRGRYKFLTYANDL